MRTVLNEIDNRRPEGRPSEEVGTIMEKTDGAMGKSRVGRAVRRLQNAARRAGLLKATSPTWIHPGEDIGAAGDTVSFSPLPVEHAWRLTEWLEEIAARGPAAPVSGGTTNLTVNVGQINLVIVEPKDDSIGPAA